jgi:cytochrome c oxidase cbb3-type subunit 3/ubiquinol-cytochrome c reductase cytochrome c subunit
MLSPPVSSWRSLLATVLVAVLIVASGTMQCELPAQVASAHRGQQLYSTMCAVCHAADGAGYAADHAPALAQHEFLASVTDDTLREAITNGRQATTMSAWGSSRGGPLRPADVDALIAYLRTWQTPPSARLDESPLTGDATRGTEIYASACASCHGADGKGGAFESLRGQVVADASNGFLRFAIGRGRPGTAMPSFSAPLGARGVEDVLAFLRSWPASPATPPRAAAAKMPPLPLGPVPLNPKGPEPEGFSEQPKTTKADLIKAQLDRGARMAILDARAPTDYVGSHISGAVSVPFYDPTPYFAALPRDAWLVCYCACPHAESGQLARKLTAEGFTKVTVLDEGLGYWRSKNYGTHEGLDP